uniref:Ubiquitin fusion degradation protein UFD1 N-terminal subdomain 2 domain-containing protein n=1 Tax=Chenopodium quinoa TaxID=63459 RepID=A0A803LFP6_CHEQI
MGSRRRYDRATYVKLQPHSVKFLDIRSPKDVLESAFCSGYACLTVGDTIVIRHEGKTLYVDIVQAMPSDAVCVIETDVEVDFALPLDYIEPPKPVSKPLPKPEKDVKESSSFVPFSGRGRRLNESNYTANEDLAAVVISNTSTKLSSETSNIGQSLKPPSPVKNTA